MIQSIKKLGNKIVIIKDGKVYSFNNTVKNSKISKLLKTL